MNLFELLFDYTFRNVILGSGIIGFLGGITGSFVILKKQSMIGDALSHSTLPGFVVVFLLLGTNSPPIIILGGMASAWIANFFIMSIINRSKIKSDSAIGIVLSVFFGLGIFLMTLLKNNEKSKQAGMEAFLFGDASSIITSDVLMISIITLLVVSVILIFFKEFKSLTFDSEYFSSLGFSKKKCELILSSIVVLVIVTGLQIVGLILMSSLLIAPAVSARLITGNFNKMLILSGVFGSISGVTGGLISSTISRVPTGPAITITAIIIVVITIVFSSLTKKLKHKQ